MPDVVTCRAYGTVSAGSRKAMRAWNLSGARRRHAALDTIAQTLGYDVTEVDRKRVVICTPSTSHLNPAGTVHGGLAATMLDSCMGLAAQSMLERLQLGDA
jgi:acyl-coenzyme A thioesterase PaaI-like protein